MWAIKIPRFCGLVEDKPISKTSHSDRYTIYIHIKHTLAASSKLAYIIAQHKYIHVQIHTLAFMEPHITGH